MAEDTTVPPILDRARVLVDPALREAVRGLDPLLRRPAEYHFGWIDADGAPAAGGSGKGLRSALAVLSAEAASAPPEVAVPGAVAVELVHNFSLVHDDIIDNDRERRHRSTVWAVFGTDEAIIAGDALHSLAFEHLLDGDEPGRFVAARRLARATGAMISGQASDMDFDRGDPVSLTACETMEAGKTAALLGYSASVGAVLAGAPVELVNALDGFGGWLGLAFQAVDDVLGVWGDPAVTGKPAGNDLRERKQSLPVAFVWETRHPDATVLRKIYQRDGELDDADVAEATDIMDRLGAREWSIERASEHIDSARVALESAPSVPAEVCSELHRLAAFVTTRHF